MRWRAGGWWARVGLAGIGLAAWDVFLDPQMVAEGYWTWRDPGPALPEVPGIPIGNYLGWLLFALLLMAVLGPAAGSAIARTGPADAPMYALYLWTYASSVLAHAVFLDLPASAVWGALAMAAVAVPLALALGRSRQRQRDDRRPGHPDPSRHVTPTTPAPNRRVTPTPRGAGPARGADGARAEPASGTGGGSR